MLYIDQPIGTGFATGESLLESNAEITDHFFQWLKEFFKEFPVLKSKKIYLMGESYAGIYVRLFIKISQYKAQKA